MFGSLSDQQRRQALLVIVVAALGYFVDIYDLLLFTMLRVRSLKDLGVSDVDRSGPEACPALEHARCWRHAGRRHLLGHLGRQAGAPFGALWIDHPVQLGERGQWHGADRAAVRGHALPGRLRPGGRAGRRHHPGGGDAAQGEPRLRHQHRGGRGHHGRGGRLPGQRRGPLARGLLHRRRLGIGPPALAHRRGGIGDVQALEVQQRVARRLSACSSAPGSASSSYAAVIAIGVPLWYLVGILITFSPEFGKAFDIAERHQRGEGRGLLLWRPGRRRLLERPHQPVAEEPQKGRGPLHDGPALGAAIAYFTLGGSSVEAFYLACCVLLGLSGGYWALFVTIGAEQFGTNIRATVTTTVPNFVRGAVPLMTLSFVALKGPPWAWPAAGPGRGRGRLRAQPCGAWRAWRRPSTRTWIISSGLEARLGPAPVVSFVPLSIRLNSRAL